jgi:hypothetical protein
MKINELLEATSTPEDEAKKLLAEFRALLDNAGVKTYGLNFSTEHANKSEGTIGHTTIFSFIIPEVENGEYDADEANLSLRLAHRLISKWLNQKEANGQPVIVSGGSDVGGGRKFSPRPHFIWAGSKYVEGSSIYVAVSIAHKNTGAAN